MLKRAGRFSALTAVMIASAILTGCEEPNGNSTNQNSMISNPSPKEAAFFARPSEESELLEIPDQAQKAVKSSPNQYQVDKAEVKWINLWCGKLKSINSFHEWTGVLSDITNGRIEIEISDDVKFYIFEKEHGSFFTKVSDWKTGIPIKISGSVDSDSISCNEWFDLTGRTVTIKPSHIEKL